MMVMVVIRDDDGDDDGDGGDKDHVAHMSTMSPLTWAKVGSCVPSEHSLVNSSIVPL